jgi:WD40 repeat protein
MKEIDFGEMTPLRGHTNGIVSAVFSSDGKKILSGSWDCTIRIWNVSSGE